MILIWSHCGLRLGDSKRSKYDRGKERTKGARREAMREITDILNFRGDISPFLVHLTRDAKDGRPARDVLHRIIDERRLIAGPSTISDARFGTKTFNMSPKEQRRYFGAV